jgi:glycosyltransferase involved in cell wall biosynthesis
MRFVWRKKEYLREERISFWQRVLLEIGIPFLRAWDLKTNQGVTHFVANSENVKNRIQSYYHREAIVIHPPVEDIFFKNHFSSKKSKDQGYYLVLSRLLGYKRIDLAVAACTQLSRSLKVVGSGRHLQYLKRMAGSNVEFLGHATDSEVHALIAGARAVIVPGEEDFGIVPLEAMAMGKPVIAYGAGGVLESVQAFKTGIFFKKQTVSNLKAAIRHFETMRFKPQAMWQRANAFSERAFKQKLKALIQHV